MNGPGAILRLFSWALVGGVLALAAPASSVAATVDRDPKPHVDAGDAPGSPLDVRSISFGQRGSELVLRITTAADWATSQLSASEGRALCVKLFYGQLLTPRGRICVFHQGEEFPALTYSRLDPFGRSVENTIVDASIRRTDRRSLLATFDPSSVNLGLGRYSWQAESTWSCEAPQACHDLVPDGGNVIAQIRTLAEPPCFGAAARAPRRRCRNPALRLAVVPTPEEAALAPNSRCEIVSTRMPLTCSFGVRRAIAGRAIALVGDSHATHWRGALEVVAQARRYHGYSLTRSGCPLSSAIPDLSRARRVSCTRWRRSVFRWLAQHREVRTLFVSQLAGLDVRVPRGRSERAHQIQGYLRAWRRVPRSVRQIIVLRDTPVTTLNAPLCVERAVRRRRPPGASCAIARRRALPIDPAAIAARRRGTRRVHVVDMTRFMCSARLCFPVVGGALVHKDLTHITNIFAGTLGPFMMVRVNRLLG